jgi:hypothetical protein
MTGRFGMVETEEGIPRRRFTVQVHATGLLVDFIDEVSVLDHRVVAGVSKNYRKLLSMCSQMTGERVLCTELGGSTDRNMMPFYEDGIVLPVHESGT